MRMRADKFFANRFGSRTKAKEALEKGLVTRDGKRLSPSDEVSDGDSCAVSEFFGFVSNGGYKLERGLEVFRESVCGLTFVDLGASTGGFTDCLLKRGAKRVFCVDVGESQLDPALAADPRVTAMDRTNARYLTADCFPEKIDGVVSDLSFISLKLVLNAIADILPCGGNAYLLFKPQFECNGVGLGKSGILPVRYHAALLRDFYGCALNAGLAVQNVVNAPLREKKNIEYVVFLQKGAQPIPEWDFLQRSSQIYEEKQKK